MLYCPTRHLFYVVSSKTVVVFVIIVVRPVRQNVENVNNWLASLISSSLEYGISHYKIECLFLQQNEANSDRHRQWNYWVHHFGSTTTSKVGRKSSRREKCSHFKIRIQNLRDTIEPRSLYFFGRLVCKRQNQSGTKTIWIRLESETISV